MHVIIVSAPARQGETFFSNKYLYSVKLDGISGADIQFSFENTGNRERERERERERQRHWITYAHCYLG